MQGEGGVGKNMILYYTGGGGGLERGQIVLHNTWTLSKSFESDDPGLGPKLLNKLSLPATTTHQ